jgi:uncharacterized membrane protein
MTDIFLIIHPMFASFPFVILALVFLTELGSFFTDTTQWRIHACFLVCITAVVSIVSYYTGYYSAEIATSASATFKVPEHLISQHQGAAKLFLLSMFPTTVFCLLRSIKESEFVHWIYTPCLICSLLLSGVASHRGGMLVFKEGAGVVKDYREIKMSEEDNTMIQQLEDPKDSTSTPPEPTVAP